MSEAENNTQRATGASEAGRNGGTSPEQGAATTPGTSGGGDMPDRSETGVTLGAGEPDTFEPEESAPAPEKPAE
jgi:hypothetical protein